MPPAFRNHLVPIACGTPAETAAPSLDMPDAMAAQNRRCSSRLATGGRPGDNNGGRPDRPERRFRLVIATSYLKVLRRPVEFTQYTCLGFGGRCREAGVRPSMGSVGDAYDNAMCESFFATLECELLARRRFTSQAEARITIFSFVEGWYNPGRVGHNLHRKKSRGGDGNCQTGFFTRATVRASFSTSTSRVLRPSRRSSSRTRCSSSRSLLAATTSSSALTAT
jgi:putative transposase